MEVAALGHIGHEWIALWLEGNCGHVRSVMMTHFIYAMVFGPSVPTVHKCAVLQCNVFAKTGAPAATVHHTMHAHTLVGQAMASAVVGQEVN